MLKTLLTVASQDPHEYKDETENDPLPLMLYRSHYSHKAPMCPTEQS